jgi:acetylornithine deacetylase/succinyl-diaminopimelate desuccinylase-like protein
VALTFVLGFVFGSHAVTPAHAVEPVDYDAVAGAARTLLADLIAADTSNPPGNEERAVALGVARLRDAGLPYEVTTFAPGRQNLVVRLRGDGSARPLLVLAHVDVVGADGQDWATPPHVLTERDGYLYGRGVADDLGMAAVALEVLIATQRSTRTLARDVIVAWTGDEESGGDGIQWLLEHRPELIDAEIAINEGGGVRLDEAGGVQFLDLQTAEKQYRDFTLTAHGATGHSSVPLADNAIYRLARGLDRLGRHQFPVRLLPVTRAWLAGRAERESPERAVAMRALAEADGEPPLASLAVLEQDPVVASTIRTTCVATLVGGGTRVNALPATATANVNCRILPDEAPADMVATLAAILDDPAIEITAIDDHSGPPSPLHGAGPAAIREVAAALWPEAPIVPSMSRGATDSRHLRAAGIASYGLSPIAITLADTRRAHGIDERIPADSLRPAVEFLHRLVDALAGTPVSP